MLLHGHKSAHAHTHATASPQAGKCLDYDALKAFGRKADRERGALTSPVGAVEIHDTTVVALHAATQAPYTFHPPQTHHTESWRGVNLNE